MRIKSVNQFDGCELFIDDDISRLCHFLYFYFAISTWMTANLSICIVRTNTHTHEEISKWWNHASTRKCLPLVCLATLSYNSISKGAFFRPKIHSISLNHMVSPCILLHVIISKKSILRSQYSFNALCSCVHVNWHDFDCIRLRFILRMSIGLLDEGGKKQLSKLKW